MHSNTPTASPFPDGTPPSMMLPDTVIGYIDVATLQDIHQYLDQSALEDDLALAAWVKEHFLYEPVTSPGREIRTTLGFFQLNRAYRRVRSLTNKAQDKWPFFSRAWKELPATKVRSYARGEAAPGVPLAGLSNATHDSPTSDGDDGHKSVSLCDIATAESLSEHGTGSKIAVTSPFMPMGTTEPTRHNINGTQQRQTSSNPIPNTSIPLPPTRKRQRSSSSGSQMHSHDPDQSNSELRSQPDPASIQAVPEEPTGVSADATVASDVHNSIERVQTPIEDDLEGGKVRGSNGRFMPKEDSTRSKCSSKARPTRKFKVAKLETPDVEDIKPMSPASATIEVETMVTGPLTPDSVVMPTPSEVTPAPAPAPTLPYKLAAESEAIWTTLDRLPPGSWLAKKRKMDARAEEGSPRKRARPSLLRKSKVKDQEGDTVAVALPSPERT